MYLLNYLLESIQQEQCDKGHNDKNKINKSHNRLTTTHYTTLIPNKSLVGQVEIWIGFTPRAVLNLSKLYDSTHDIF